MSKKIELKTERLILRPVVEQNAKAIFNYRSDSITNKYQGWIPESIEDVHGFLKKISSKINIDNTWFQFVIIDIEKSDVIGDSGIHLQLPGYRNYNSLFLGILIEY